MFRTANGWSRSGGARLVCSIAALAFLMSGCCYDTSGRWRGAHILTDHRSGYTEMSPCDTLSAYLSDSAYP